MSKKDDDDFTMGEVFNAMKKVKQEKRASNREQSAELLVQAGVLFEEKNGGAHLIVEGPDGKVDFWPGTGKWTVRGGKTSRGVRNLLKFLGVELPPSDVVKDAARYQQVKKWLELLLVNKNTEDEYTQVVLSGDAPGDLLERFNSLDELVDQCIEEDANGTS